MLYWSIMYIIRNIAKQFDDLDFQVRKFIPAICIILTIIIVSVPGKACMYIHNNDVYVCNVYY